MSKQNNHPGIERKTYIINQVQLWLAIATLIGGGGLAWAKGWLNMPDKVAALEAKQALVDKSEADTALLAPRITAVEHQQSLIWEKVSGDHDLLIDIKRGLQDVKDQNDESKADTKSIRDRPH